MSAEGAELSPERIRFPERDRNRDAFHMWAAQHFDDELRDPLRRNYDGGAYFHPRVNDAWMAWKTSGECVDYENTRLRKLLDELTKHTLSTSPLNPRG